MADCDPWAKRFEELDVDGSGKLDRDDIMALGRQGSAVISTKELLGHQETGTSKVRFLSPRVRPSDPVEMIEV